MRLLLLLLICFLGASTKIVDRSTGKITFGRVPRYSVVVPGSINANNTKKNIVHYSKNQPRNNEY